jgi:hypothetical protein
MFILGRQFGDSATEGNFEVYKRFHVAGHFDFGVIVFMTIDSLGIVELI